MTEKHVLAHHGGQLKYIVVFCQMFLLIALCYNRGYTRKVHKTLLLISFHSLVSSVVDVIKNTGEGALEIFQFLLKNCQESEGRGDH